MIEESVEGFITHYLSYAAEVELLSHIEGSPLLECWVGKTVIHVLERTSPYASRPGSARLIINPTVEAFRLSEVGHKEINAIALGQLQAAGEVIASDLNVAIVDVGVPLVVTMIKDIPDDLGVGDWVEFESIAPVHGFLVPERRILRHRQADAESL